MAKTTTETAAAEVPAAQTEQTALSLEEFCRRLSTTETRVELIGGFFADEQAAGHLNDTESNFVDRYQKFINRPA